MGIIGLREVIEEMQLFLVAKNEYVKRYNQMIKGYQQNMIFRVYKKRLYNGWYAK